MSIASSARRTASESLSALLQTCTVAIPSSRAARLIRTAISPRLAMRSFLMVMNAGLGSNLGSNLGSHVDLGDRLAGHHGFLILRQEAHDLARRTGLHLIERFHHLDQADGVIFRDGVAGGLVVRLVGGGLAVEDAG